MGGACSYSIKSSRTVKVKSKVVRVSSHSYGDQIDVATLFSALVKLSFVFEIKDSLALSLTAEINNPKHANFDAQFVAVEAWMVKHGRHGHRGSAADLTAKEIDYLIQYVELYEPLPEEKEAVSVHSNNNADMSDWVTPVCPLTCPRVSELAALTGEIRSQEAKRLRSSSWHLPLDTPTIRHSCSSTTERYVGSQSFQFQSSASSDVDEHESTLCSSRFKTAMIRKSDFKQRNKSEEEEECVPNSVTDGCELMDF